MADPIDVVLVRHGRTAHNAERRFLGRTDAPLDDVGRAQAEALRDAADVGTQPVAWASPLLRAQQTAAAFADEVRAVPGLEELHQGDLEGMAVHEAVARWPTFFAQWQLDPTGIAVPGGEALDACRDRAIAALEGVVASADGPTLHVVTHQLVIASVCTVAAGVPLGDWRRFTVQPTGRRRLRWDGGWRLIEG